MIEANLAYFLYERKVKVAGPSKSFRRAKKRKASEMKLIAKNKIAILIAVP